MDTRELAFDAGGLEIRIVNVAVDEYHINDVVANVAFTLHLVEANRTGRVGGQGAGACVMSGDAIQRKRDKRGAHTLL